MVRTPPPLNTSDPQQLTNMSPQQYQSLVAERRYVVECALRGDYSGPTAGEDEYQVTLGGARQGGSMYNTYAFPYLLQPAQLGPLLDDLISSTNADHELYQAGRLLYLAGNERMFWPAIYNVRTEGKTGSDWWDSVVQHAQRTGVEHLVDPLKALDDLRASQQRQPPS